MYAKLAEIIGWKEPIMTAHPGCVVKPPALKTVDAISLSQNVKDTLKSYSLSSSYNWLRDESCFVDLPSQSLNKRLVNNNDKKNKKQKTTRSLLNPAHATSSYISLEMVFMNNQRLGK